MVWVTRSETDVVCVNVPLFLNGLKCSYRPRYKDSPLLAIPKLSKHVS